MTPRHFTRRDLLEAYLAVERAPDDFNARRYQALAGAFDCWLERPGHGPALPASWLAALELPSDFGPETWADPEARWALHRLFRRVTDELQRVDSPFMGAGERVPAVAAFHARHAYRINGLLGGLRDAYMRLLEDLVEAIWGLSLERTVGAGDLRRHGFDPEMELDAQLGTAARG